MTKFYFGGFYSYAFPQEEVNKGDNEEIKRKVGNMLQNTCFR